MTLTPSTKTVRLVFTALLVGMGGTTAVEVLAAMHAPCVPQLYLCVIEPAQPEHNLHDVTSVTLVNA
jgi:hypothetical protein